MPYNTLIVVHCDKEFFLMGGDIIACIKGLEYRTVYGQLPSCNESEYSTCILDEVIYRACIRCQ